MPFLLIAYSHMKRSKPNIKNIAFFVLIALFLIPQTRQPIQVALHKVFTLFSPSTIEKTKQVTITDYNWKLRDTKGVVLNFQDLQGRVILINFWATWCPPCIAEMPSIQNLYNDYKDNIEFLFVSNEAHSKIDQFLIENDYSFSVYNPITDYPAEFNGVTSIPRTFLIDKAGHIIIDKNGAANWNSETVRSTIDGLLGVY